MLQQQSRLRDSYWIWCYFSEQKRKQQPDAVNMNEKKIDGTDSCSEFFPIVWGISNYSKLQEVDSWNYCLISGQPCSVRWLSVINFGNFWWPLDDFKFQTIAYKKVFSNSKFHEVVATGQYSSTLMASKF